MNNVVLVVAAHSDDEALGCGGTIARHTTQGDQVSLVVMADGVVSRESSTSEDLEIRRRSAEIAQNVLGITESYDLGFPDNRMDSVPLLDIVRELETVIDRLGPSMVYTHHHGDLNVDHRLTHQAVMTACRPQPRASVKEIHGFEVLSSTEWATPQASPFIPNMYVDISSSLDTKIKALEAYRQEMRPVPHSRSVEHVQALARHRGYSVGVEAAEAFVVYRCIR